MAQITAAQMSAMATALSSRRWITESRRIDGAIGAGGCPRPGWWWVCGSCVGMDQARLCYIITFGLFQGQQLGVSRPSERPGLHVVHCPWSRASRDPVSTGTELVGLGPTKSGLPDLGAIGCRSRAKAG